MSGGENLEKEEKQIDKEASHSKPKIRLDNIKEELNVEDVTEQGFEYEVVHPISNVSKDLSGYGEEDVMSMMEKSLNMIANGREN